MDRMHHHAETKGIVLPALVRFSTTYVMEIRHAYPRLPGEMEHIFLFGNLGGISFPSQEFICNIEALADCVSKCSVPHIETPLLIEVYSRLNNLWVHFDSSLCYNNPSYTTFHYVEKPYLYALSPNSPGPPVYLRHLCMQKLARRLYPLSSVEEYNKNKGVTLSAASSAEIRSGFKLLAERLDKLTKPVQRRNAKKKDSPFSMNEDVDYSPPRMTVSDAVNNFTYYPEDTPYVAGTAGTFNT